MSPIILLVSSLPWLLLLIAETLALLHQGWQLPQGACIRDGPQDPALQQLVAPLWGGQGPVHLPCLWPWGAATGGSHPTAEVQLCANLPKLHCSCHSKHAQIGVTRGIHWDFKMSLQCPTDKSFVLDQASITFNCIAAWERNSFYTAYAINLKKIVFIRTCPAAMLPLNLCRASNWALMKGWGGDYGRFL